MIFWWLYIIAGLGAVLDVAQVTIWLWLPLWLIGMLGCFVVITPWLWVYCTHYVRRW